MPILRGSVTFARYRLQLPEKGASNVRRFLTAGLSAHAFEPIDRKSDEDRATGFVELENNAATEFSPGTVFYAERALFAFRVDTIRVSAAHVRDEVARWLVTFERENSRKPGRTEKAEAKAGIRQKLRNRAPEQTKVHDVAWNLKSDQLQIWASSRKAIEEVSAAIEAALGVKLLPLVPGAMALDRGLDESALEPTAELVGKEVA
jgi:DNA recombination-dependent growth factor C